MKRTKSEGVYYVTIGGGIEDFETPEQAVIRELKEESGSIIKTPIWVFHYDDVENETALISLSAMKLSGLSRFFVREISKGKEQKYK